MHRYRKKPVEIDAMQFTGGNSDDVLQWIRAQKDHPEVTFASNRIWIETLEGTMTARPGDWVVRGVQGEYYPVKPEIFEATYEPVEEGA